MHVCFTPITKDKRLSTREIFGGRAGLSAWQDRFHSYMSERWPVLERGRSVAETRREHLSVQLFKQATRLDRQIASLSSMLEDVSVLNIRKKKEELTAALSTLLPAADRFQKQVAALEGYERKLKLNSALMGEELREAKQENTKLFLTMKDLQRRNDEVERLLDRIPDDVLEAARAMPTRRRER
ncbi:MAG: plasmid recombination protein, partial [Eubacteriales bacterium]|nr:plasmid recombination protein [Eubacteriales bacterium]